MNSFSPLAKLSLCASLALLTAACDSDKELSNNTAETASTVKSAVKEEIKAAATLRPLVDAKADVLTKNSYLRERLTEKTVAYARIPHIWSFLGSPTGNTYDAAYSSKAFVDATSKIKKGFVKNIIPEIPEELRSVIMLLTKSVTSPIEIAVVKAEVAEVVTPNVLVSAAVDFENTASIQALLSKLTATGAPIEITKPINTEGYAELDLEGSKVQILWDQATSRIFVLGGVSTETDSIANVVKTFVTNDVHPMLTAEKDIDSSGQGTFAWVNPKYFSELSRVMGLEKEYMALAMTGVASMKSIAAGVGTSNGLNRMKYVVDMPVFGFRAYIPVIKSSPTFNISGKTDLIATIGLPDKKSVLAFEQLSKMGMHPKQLEQFTSFKKTFSDTLGFGYEELFDMLGQDFSLVSGEVGMHFAMRLNDKQAFQTMVEKCVTKFELKYEQREINGQTFHHLIIPPIQSDIDNVVEAFVTLDNDIEPEFLKRLVSASSHVYWQIDGDYIITAATPQTLMERHNLPSQAVNDWLENEQHIDPTGSLFMLALNTDGSSTMMYRLQLGLLSYLGDIVGEPIDLFTIPTPQEANLQEAGSAAIKITSSDTQIAFELAYEHNPIEILLSPSGYMGILTVGMISSIAIPAYEDYSTRAKLHEGIASASDVKIAIMNYKTDNARYPSAAEVEQLGLNRQGSNYSIHVVADTGEIVIEFIDASLRGTGRTITMTPPQFNNSTTWSCESDMHQKYHASTCSSSRSYF